MDFFTATAFFATFAQLHWQSLSAAVTFATGAGLVALRNHAYKQFALEAAVVAEQVAKLELKDDEKRHKVIDATYDVLPLWVQKLVSKTAAEKLADDAFAKLG